MNFNKEKVDYVPIWKDDKELYFLAKQELFTALAGDVLAKLLKTFGMKLIAVSYS